MGLKISDLFYDEYEESRKNFIESLKYIKVMWPNAELESIKIGEKSEETYIDIIKTEAINDRGKFILMTTGEHGIEGYVGAGMLKLFIYEELEKLNPDNTGIMLIHAINPWGMKHKRRSNENNVDLNRNFIFDWDNDNRNNENYNKISLYFGPNKKIGSVFQNNVSFFFSTISNLLKIGANNLQTATLIGQYEFNKGIYYGGNQYQSSTKEMIDLYNEVLNKQYKKFIHIDIHTGYGPSNQMSIVNSKYEERDSDDLKKQFSYPLIEKTNAEEFYSINGDMIDFMYKLSEEKYKGDYFYSTCFEFGTFGDSLKNSLRSLKTSINENRLYWNGTDNDNTDKYIRKEFIEMFYPSSLEWREKAVNDFKQAISGIFKSEKFI